MSTPVPRKAIRLDEDLHETLRQQAFYGNSSITRLANDLIRNALLLAEAGMFSSPGRAENVAHLAKAGLFDRPLGVSDLKRALELLAKDKKEKS